ncbi:MAG: 4-hydroxybenzoate octaprenyltransferase [Rickettsiales bacterium]|nr:4-hydroxybenzoate octaprenyltransferase [Rickettsiales bacterium]
MYQKLLQQLINAPFYGDWVYNPKFTKIRPYLELMRLQHPAGIYFLLLPCLVSIALASEGEFKIFIILYFIIGSILMRAAGCIINDIIDRDIDKQVERTKNRPLAAGTISVKKASLFLCCLLLISAFILLQLNVVTQILGLLILVPVFLYPLMKRITNWPQLFLGITINWGALMGRSAVTGTIDTAPVLIYFGAITWTLAYDTIYAQQDKEHDVLIGVKSTAVYLGDSAPSAIRLFYMMTCIFWLFAVGVSGITDTLFYVLAGIIVYLTNKMLKNMDYDDPTSCMLAFKLNAWIGIAFLIMIIIFR